MLHFISIATSLPMFLLEENEIAFPTTLATVLSGHVFAATLALTNDLRGGV